MEGQTTVHSLDDDCLAALINCLPPETRANTVPLVCKTWQRVERERPYQPTLLTLRSEAVDDSFLAWHLRDTSKLETAAISGDLDQDHYVSSDSYRDWVPTVFGHLQASAPLLRHLFMAYITGDTLEAAGLEVLDLIGGLSQLERLSFLGWEYTPDDAVSFHHLTRLQSLQTLELSELRISEQYDEELQHWSWFDAADNLRDSIHNLQLTSLTLTEVDFIMRNVVLIRDGMEVILPTRAVGSLTKLRSLTYDCDRLPGNVQFPFINQLVELTRLCLTAKIEEDSLPDTFAGLTALQEVAIINWANQGLQPMQLSTATAMTRLAVEGLLVRGRPLSVVLPAELLTNIRCLTLNCIAQSNEDAISESPAAWGKLTSLTHLAYQVTQDLLSDVYPLPDFVPHVKSLKLVELTSGYELFSRIGEGYVLRLTGSLPLLSQLEITVRGIPEPKEADFEQQCASLSEAIPQWQYSIRESSCMLGRHLHRIVAFALDL